MKVLIVRFSSIGDIVLTSPVVRAAKLQLGAEVHFLTKSAYHTVVAFNPYVDRILTLENGIREMLEILRKEKYDLLIDLHHNLRSSILRMRLGISSVSFDKLNFEKWLMVRLKRNFLPDKHLVDRYFDALEGYGLVNDGKGLEYFLPDDIDERWVDFLGLHPQYKHLMDIVAGGQFITMPIGAAHKTKSIPVSLGREICTSASLPVILLSGPDYQEEGRLMAVGPNSWDLCGKTSIPLSAWLIRKSALVITPDTGMMHIAAAFRKKILSIWGNTIPSFGMYPYYGREKASSEIFEVPGLGCRPCSKIGFEKCPKGHFRCMLDQNPMLIIRKAHMLIEK